MPSATPKSAARRRKVSPDSEPTADARLRLTPEVWIAAATEVLVDRGIDHVRVDLLATELKVTRGSFYWHFRDREDLLRRVLQTWSDVTTQQLTRRLESAQTDPRQQLRDVISLPFRGRAAARGARIELAIRAWARRDAMAQQAVDAADRARLRYHQQIFGALGFSADEAAHRAFALYSCEVGESMLSRQGTPEQKQRRSEFVERLMQTPVAPAGQP